MDHPRPAERLAKLDGLHILVVDDDADALELLTTVLETRNAQVTSAGSAGEAMQRMLEGRPDLLISDIGMPGEDGYSLIRRVRTLNEQQGGAVPAIALTAFNQDRDRQKALGAGFSGHMSKPVDLSLLCSEIVRLARDDSARRNPLEHLRSATRLQHERLEQQPYAQRVMGGRVSRPEYGGFLQAMYLLHQELEADIARSPEPALREVFSEDMRKLDWLASDLRELGYAPVPSGAVAVHAESLAARYHAAAESDPFFLLGALYVLEGSSLGGRVQRSALLARHEFAQLKHHYLSGYQSGTRQHFDRFAQRLTRALDTEQRLERASVGAVATFEGLSKVLDAIVREDSVRISTDLGLSAAPAASAASSPAR